VLLQHRFSFHRCFSSFGNLCILCVLCSDRFWLKCRQRAYVTRAIDGAYDAMPARPEQAVPKYDRHAALRLPDAIQCG
jgi:hypothetical protein